MSSNYKNKYLDTRKAEGDLRHAEEKVMGREAEILQAANTTQGKLPPTRSQKRQGMGFPKRLWNDMTPPHYDF